MPADILNQFYTAITAIANRGDAREESYYSTLEALFEGYAAQTGRKNTEVRTLPRKTEAGNPDFRIWDGLNQITGYIEAKAPSEANLDVIEESEQLKRYRNTFPNLILTNFFEFRLYRNGDLVETVLAARPVITFKLNKVPPVEKGEELLSLFEKFFSFSMPRTFTAESLAVELAKRTRFLREIVEEQLQLEEKQGSGDLTGFYEAFRDYLIAHLNREDFADLYSQTVTYGLFAARTRAKQDFSRKTAYDYIPNTIGILKEVFQFVSLGTIPEQLEWIIDEIAQVLAVAEPGAILDRFYHEGKGADPVVHFYETFLAQYDPKEREQRGVYYTPPPVVSYIVRSLNHLLKKSFAKANGLASEGVTLLDPAAGTMTFVARASMEALKEQESAFGSGGNDEFIRSHIMENFYAFELMMAPYAVGHLKMSFILEELGHQLTGEERFKFYLTNTLEMEELAQTTLPVVRSIAKESREAGKVKKDQPILVILGNPPYSGHSKNPSYTNIEVKSGDRYKKMINNEWHVVTAKRKGTKKVPTFIGELHHDYFMVDGRRLEERNPKWLQDDYVKFIRWVQWKIDKLGQGVVGMITNHSYLDNPTFRGMRQSLMQTYDEIYLLDLHGNALKKEKAPDGSDDKNVFDIRLGVAVAFFIKKGNSDQDAQVFHADLWGTRQDKYDWLEDHDLPHTGWKKITPQSPFYFFVPRDEEALARYQKYPSVTSLFPVNSVGIVTARDHLAIHWTSDAVWDTVRTFVFLEPELAREAYKLGRDVRDWKVEWAQKDLKVSGPNKEKITPLLYRPFDTRHTYFTGKSRGFHCYPRTEVMRHMLAGDNLGLITSRMTKGETFKHAQVTDKIIEVICMSPKTSNNGFLFPLYLHPDVTKTDLFHDPDTAQIEPNLAPELVVALTDAYGNAPLPKDIFHYVYAVLYSPTYRELYTEFLKTDFPRVPFTAEASLFQQMADLGERLVNLHLLRDKGLDRPGIHFDGEGSNQVARNRGKGYRYEPDEQRIYINTEQYFHPVPLEVWSYQIGGYQVLDKWLKDRKDRSLSLEDIRHYCRVITALSKTIGLQREIDELYPQVEEETLLIIGK